MQYVLAGIESDGEPPEPSRPEEALHPLSLLLHPTEAGPNVYSKRIIFSRTPLTRGFYRFAVWTAPPPERFLLLLRDRLRREHLFEAVSAHGTNADLALLTELGEFYHDATEAPGAVVVDVHAELLTLVDRQLIATETFRARVPVKTFDAGGAVIAFTHAVELVLEDIVAWLGELPLESAPGVEAAVAGPGSGG